MSTGAPVLPPPVSADPTVDFVGLFVDQTEETILSRMAAWANEGLDPADDADQWVDTREGGHWFTCVMPAAREIARLYDVAGTEVPMAAMMLWAWGTYLDDLAAAGGVERLPATSSTGTETFSGPAGTIISEGTTVATVPTGPDDPTPTFRVTQAGTIPDAGAGTGSIDLPIEATEAGFAGDVAASAITAPSTPLPAGVTFTNAQPTLGGTDPETDEALRTRVLQAIAGTAGANQAAYQKRAAAWASVGSVKVVPTWAGPNSVLVMVADPQGRPLPPSVVAGLQADLDPDPGKGSGFAPVGAQVTVETSVARNITVDATVTWLEGYSATGTANTVALGPDIATAIAEYLLAIKPGEAARVSHVAGIIATWTGVDNVTGVLLNGAAADVVLALSPPESAQLVQPISFH